MTLSSLEEIGRRHCTDKSTWLHNYLGFYERFLAPIRHRATSVLEIGVFQGHSLTMWEEYFPKAEVVGVDIDPTAAQHARGRVHIEIADQSSSSDLERIATKHGPFDLIIDDGSHIWSHQIL